jgi:DNA-binding transcriptional regulator YiaG
MTTFADALKREISRIARKELKSEVGRLRELVSSYRGEVAALKRDIKNLQLRGKVLTKSAERPDATSNAVAHDSNPVGLRRGRKPAYSPETLKALRKQFGVTQVQLATLLEVSSVTVYKWESGQTVPRAAHQEKIFWLCSLGKRAAMKMVADSAQANGE